MPSRKRERALRTVGEIATEFGVAPSRISYAIQAYSIKPTQRAGILRLFDASRVDQIRAALVRISERRTNAGVINSTVVTTGGSDAR